MKHSLSANDIHFVTSNESFPQICHVSLNYVTHSQDISHYYNLNYSIMSFVQIILYFTSVWQRHWQTPCLILLHGPLVVYLNTNFWSWVQSLGQMLVACSLRLSKSVQSSSFVQRTNVDVCICKRKSKETSKTAKHKPIVYLI